MSVSLAVPPSGPPASPPTTGTSTGLAPTEGCPLCRSLLRADQDWCLHCGAAARTRLAAPPRWKGLVAGLIVVSAISLAVLALALVKLIG